MAAYTSPIIEERRKRKEEREMRSSSLTLDLKESKLQDSGKEEEGKMSNELHVLGMNDDFWDRVCGLGSEI